MLTLSAQPRCRERKGEAMLSRTISGKDKEKSTLRASDYDRRSWLVALAGIAFVVAAIATNQSWLDRHFLPSFLMSRQVYVRIETSVRMALAASGFVLILAARRLATMLTTRTIAIVAAIAIALGASEVVLRNVRLRPAEWRAVSEEPLRRNDPRLGWTFVPSRTGFNTNGGRTIAYTFDAGGYRIRSADRPVDPARPSVLFAGESVMFGDSLTYDESVPAQVEDLLGVQSVNMAVYGYSTDQMYLKVE